MEPIERRILLQQLQELDECTEARILFSSRPEDDIAKFLDTTAASIIVNHNNSASIQIYVNQRIQSWLDNVDFVAQARKKIRQLLSPLAANANGQYPGTQQRLLVLREGECTHADIRSKGMFLYARIILDNAELLTSLDEIEQELRVLPRDLDEV